MDGHGFIGGIKWFGERLNLLNTSLSSYECAQLIKPYERDPKQFKDWIKSIEKCAYLTQCPAD